jgi:hypothetical protein
VNARTTASAVIPAGHLARVRAAHAVADHDQRVSGSETRPGSGAQSSKLSSFPERLRPTSVAAAVRVRLSTGIRGDPSQHRRKLGRPLRVGGREPSAAPEPDG